MAAQIKPEERMADKAQDGRTAGTDERHFTVLPLQFQIEEVIRPSGFGWRATVQPLPTVHCKDHESDFREPHVCWGTGQDNGSRTGGAEMRGRAEAHTEYQTEDWAAAHPPPGHPEDWTKGGGQEEPCFCLRSLSSSQIGEAGKRGRKTSAMQDARKLCKTKEGNSLWGL
ncbi:hypothetical protein HPG69_003504 [Diceros bicornis minor]|uniref:Uncharacterized protein n=1 Tax=Diceros bicornis minor TaxID=77932 RepID=A0A7J7FAL3_DICBM|nr:hypothetical protein HPG69_003504 [Diceros bicornis minor]